jgi:hypothetical protein
MDAKREQRILDNCHPSWWKQYQGSSTTARLWAKLTPEIMIDLLSNCAYAANFQARQILQRMETANTPWLIRATAHQGGTGDNERGADENLHITLKAGGISYHLRCKESPRLHIIQITR